MQSNHRLFQRLLWNSIVNIEANNQELTFEQLKTLYAGNNLTLRENTFQRNLNLLTRDGTYNLMAGILADVNSYSIKVAVFRGTNKTDLVKRNEYGYKCMLVAVKQVLDYMEALNDTIVDVGGLPEGLTLEEFYEGKSKPVNLELQQIMVQLGYIEQTGHGVPLIVSRYGKKVFDITENFITVTIPLNRTERTESDLLQNKKVLLEDSDEKIVSLMKENSSIKVNEISRQVGLGMTTITKRIRQLKEKGIIERKGSKKKGY